MPFLEIREKHQQHTRRYRLVGPTVLIGRAPNSTIIVRDKTVSRKHLQLDLQGDQIMLHDVGSMFGTKVNGVDTSECLLENGDQILIGSSKLTFLSSEDLLADSDEIVSFETGGQDRNSEDLPLESAVPRLKRRWTHRSRLNMGIGMRGPGE